MRRMRSGILSVLAVAWLVGSGPMLGANQPASSPTALSFTVLDAGKNAGQQTTGFFFARDQQTFEQIWSNLKLDASDRPKVNFTRRMVVAWIGGGGSCDEYTPARVREYPDKVILEIEHPHPEPDAVCTTLYVPSHVVIEIPRTAKPIEFTIAAQTRAASPGRAPPPTKLQKYLVGSRRCATCASAFEHEGCKSRRGPDECKY